MDACLSAVRSGSSAEALAALKGFNEANATRFTFADAESTREALVGALVAELRRDETIRQPELASTTLETLKIVSRERIGIDALLSDEGLRFLGQLATESTKSNRIEESALKCLCNLVYKSPKTALACFNQDVLVGIARRLDVAVAVAAVSRDVRFFELRLVFLVTALAPDTRVATRRRMLVGLVDAIGPRGAWRDDPGVLSETFKIVFTLTMDAEDVDATVLKRFVGHVRIVLGSTREDMREAKGHAVNALVNMPQAALAELVAPVREEASAFLFDDRDVSAVRSVIDMLESAMVTGKSASGDELVPTMTALSNCARANRIIRKYLRSQILPPLGRVLHKPEDSPGLKGRLVRLMTSPSSNVSALVADFLFVLCKENVSRFTKHTGYGNAAGLLLQRGLLGAAASNQSGGDYSTDEGSDTEEYLESSVDPVTGGPVKHVGSNPLDSMTEDEKEAEAEKLVNLLDQLNKTGVIQVKSLGADGKETDQFSRRRAAED